MKSNNVTGFVIIVGILAFAGMKAFDIRFNIENIKLMSAVGISIVVGILIFFGMQSKKHHDPDYYVEPEKEESSDYISTQHTHVTPQPQSYHQEEENHSYGSYNNPPPEEDNRWS